jgi:hypothetical protein
MSSDEGEPSSPAGGRKRARMTAYPVSKIKALMQDNDQIGKVAKASMGMLSKAVELFAAELTRACLVEAAKTDNKQKVTRAILQATIRSNDKFDFLMGLLEEEEEGEGGEVALVEDNVAPANDNARNDEEDNDNEEEPEVKKIAL